MIIVDLSQVSISNLMVQIGNHTNSKLEEGMLRHMVLNTLRSIRTKFPADKWGEMVIACDNKKYWRRDAFPYYKANRRKARDASELDWHAIFDFLHRFRAELVENFPYRVIDVEGAEADDVIATLVQRVTTEKVTVISGDKDFMQLQRYPHVSQYDPVRKRVLKCEDPMAFLREHVIRGDVGDGVPNVLSPDNCLVSGERQKVLTQKRMDALLSPLAIGSMSPDVVRNFKRNELLIDLTNVPSEVRDRVMESYELQAGKGRERLFDYMFTHRLNKLMEAISDF
jgi:5'-3' exonuclease, N-terminal resolvase-like domain/T4 RNase H, C terminal